MKEKDDSRDMATHNERSGLRFVTTEI